MRRKAYQLFEELNKNSLNYRSSSIYDKSGKGTKKRLYEVKKCEEKIFHLRLMNLLENREIRRVVK